LSVFENSDCMVHGKWFFIFFIAVILAGCTAMRSVPSEADALLAAEEAFLAGSYEAALAKYETLIEERRTRDEEVDGAFFRGAGLSAGAMGETGKVLEYLEPIRHDRAAGAEVFAALAKAYREVDNLSREITSLEVYIEDYPEGPEYNALRRRYFETLVESMNWEQALALWPQIEGETRADEALLNMYFTVNDAMGKEEAANEIAGALLDLNPDNADALNRLGRMHFNRALEIYERENRAYERNRTHRQYNQLLQAYEVMNQELRTALRHFLRLYELEPSRETASFLRNIYTRFNDEERAGYYERQMQD
jgi:hypothetical protein